MSDAPRRPENAAPPAEPRRHWVFPTPIPAHAVYTPPPPAPESRFQNNLRLDNRS